MTRADSDSAGSTCLTDNSPEPVSRTRAVRCFGSYVREGEAHATSEPAVRLPDDCRSDEFVAASHRRGAGAHRTPSWLAARGTRHHEQRNLLHRLAR